MNMENNMLQLISFLREENYKKNNQIELLQSQINKLQENLLKINNKVNKQQETINILIYR